MRTRDNWLGHPGGLFLLFGTEMWERFSYFAMRALLVLYLVDRVSVQGGGMGWDQADALQLYGNFTMMVYVTPLIGGWLADNHLGRRRAVLLGCLLMALGQFCLALPHQWFVGQQSGLLYAGLALLVTGNGLFKPNISTMVGELYSQQDPRRDGAFTIFYLGINLGMFLAGLAVGWASDFFGSWQWHQGQRLWVRNYQAGFLLAGVGMLLALALQLTLARRCLGRVGLKPVAEHPLRRQQGPAPPLTATERDRLKVILVMGLFTVIFWAGFEQAGGLMNLFADRFVDREMGGTVLSPAYFQSLNPLFIMIFAPLLAGLWAGLGARQPSAPIKFALGLMLLGLGFVFMLAAVMDQRQTTDGLASPWYLVMAYLFHTLGELCLSPIGLSMVTRLSPLRMASLLMGTWYLFMAAANKLAGSLGALIGSSRGGEEQQMLDNALAIFLGLTVVSLLAAVLLFWLTGPLLRWMHPDRASDPSARSEPILQKVS
ncbi:peptide MFS transporter [Bowmanella dokdonensis]|uniref:Peptide MFS transporter n=1 Tax=Bowmanella dokdonensis TaxID=751969 RepID=A0A939INV4_9ALTE|nr:peptide MFS transporter [Bowmanella dokdonensis]MBN7825240.1 peptide MFS transporter [Bowmanella dokdonensis]